MSIQNKRLVLLSRHFPEIKKLLESTAAAEESVRSARSATTAIECIDQESSLQIQLLEKKNQLLTTAVEKANDELNCLREKYEKSTKETEERLSIANEQIARMVSILDQYKYDILESKTFISALKGIRVAVTNGSQSDDLDGS